MKTAAVLLVAILMQAGGDVYLTWTFPLGVYTAVWSVRRSHSRLILHFRELDKNSLGGGSCRRGFYQRVGERFSSWSAQHEHVCRRYPYSTPYPGKHNTQKNERKHLT